MAVYQYIIISVWQYISMVAICYASDTTEYDRRRIGLSNAALHMK